jgi:hypothetical protein
MPLIAIESAGDYGSIQRHAHPLDGFHVSDRRHKDFAIVTEGDETAVKQMVVQ